MSTENHSANPFGPEDYTAVKAETMRLFEEAAAKVPPEPAATPAERVRLMGEAVTRWERAEGLNVLPFPERTASDSATSTKPEGDAA